MPNLWIVAASLKKWPKDSWHNFWEGSFIDDEPVCTMAHSIAPFTFSGARLYDFDTAGGYIESIGL